jgi:parallel beta-helix repeat protein
VPSRRPLRAPRDLGPRPAGFDDVYTVGVGGQYATIAAAVAVAGPGDQVLILPGTYAEPLSLTRSGTAAAPITFAAQTPGTVTLNGAGRSSVIRPNGQRHITIDGINVSGAANPLSTDPAAVTTSSGWRLSNMVVQDAEGVGVQVYGTDVYLYNVTAQFNGRQGIGGSDCSYVTVKDCTTRGNNTRGNDPDWDGGAGKWFHTDHVTLDGVVSYDNVGPGIWFDYLNANAVIKNCRSYNNRGLTHAYSGSGIRVELNDAPMLIANNTFSGNTGPQVDIQSSKYVTVTGNTIQGSHLALKDWPRGSQFALSDVTVTDNLFIASGVLTEGGTWTATSGAAKRLTIDRNTYQSGLRYTWNYQATYTTLAQVRSNLGFEQNGRTA